MMAEFNIQSDSVDVTRIMEQIRQRIREKRGTDYTEQQIRELATVKLDRFLDPRHVRSDLVEHYRQLEPPTALEPIPHERLVPAPEPFEFDVRTIYASSRGPMGKLIRLIRKLFNPILRLFFNPDTVVFALTRQGEINAWTLRLLQQQTDSRRAGDQAVRGARGARCPELRGAQQPRGRDDPAVCGREELPHAGGVGRGPARLRRTTGAGAGVGGSASVAAAARRYRWRGRREHVVDRVRPDPPEAATVSATARGGGDAQHWNGRCRGSRDGRPERVGAAGAESGHHHARRRHGCPGRCAASEPCGRAVPHFGSVPEPRAGAASGVRGGTGPSPMPSAPGPSDAPLPATAPATEGVRPAGPERDAGPDER